MITLPPRPKDDELFKAQQYEITEWLEMAVEWDTLNDENRKDRIVKLIETVGTYNPTIPEHKAAREAYIQSLITLIGE